MKNSAKAAARKRKAQATARRKSRKEPEVAKAHLKDAQKDLRANRSKRIIVPEGTIEIIEELDRDWAELLLSNLHKDQRKLNILNLSRIERALKDGKFEWTGDPIRIDEDGNVIDGQHRLAAVMNTGISMFNVVLITIKKRNILKVIDTTSRPRTLGDIFKVHGLKSPNNTIIAAIIYEDADFVRRQTRELSKPERFELLRNYDLTEEAVMLYNSGQRGMKITSGPLAGALRCIRKNHDLALEFFTAAFSNTHFLNRPSKDFPNEVVQVSCSQVALLANWLIHVREQQQLGTGRTSGEEFTKEGAYKAIKAWNAFRTNKHLTKLQMPRNAKMPIPRK